MLQWSARRAPVEHEKCSAEQGVLLCRAFKCSAEQKLLCRAKKCSAEQKMLCRAKKCSAEQTIFCRAFFVLHWSAPCAPLEQGACSTGAKQCSRGAKKCSGGAEKNAPEQRRVLCRARRHALQSKAPCSAEQRQMLCRAKANALQSTGSLLHPGSLPLTSLPKWSSQLFGGEHTQTVPQL